MQKQNVLQQRFFEMHKNDNNANIGIRVFTMWKQKFKQQHVAPSEYWTTGLGFQIQYPPFYTNLAFACKANTLRSLYSHALLILTKSSKSKIKWCMNRSPKIYLHTPS